MKIQGRVTWQELRKILLIIFLLLALSLVYLLVTNMIISMETGNVPIVLLIPLLAYLLLSGAIEEFDFNGLKAKFNNAASSTMRLPEPGEMTPEPGDFDQVGKQGQDAIEQMLIEKKINDTRPIVLVIILGRGDYRRSPMLVFIKELSRYRNFKLVVFLDQYDRVVATMPGWTAYQILIDDETSEKFISSVNKDSIKELCNLPKIITKQLTVQNTNSEALDQMAALNTETMAVVDADRCLKGVVEREDIVASLMLALIEKPRT